MSADLTPRPIDVVAAHLGPDSRVEAERVLAILNLARLVDRVTIGEAARRVHHEIQTNPTAFTGHEYGSARHWRDVYRALGELVDVMIRD